MGKLTVDFAMSPHKIEYFYRPRGNCYECVMYVEDMGWCNLYKCKTVPRNAECKVDTIIVKEV